MNRKQIIILILIIAWMVGMFMFSSQMSTKSTQTSGKFIGYVADKLSVTKNMSNIQRTQFIRRMQPPVRKLAHFSLYAVGGMLTFAFMNEFKISTKKKILFSILLCCAYSITDEVHQLFVPGRSGEVRDVLIDTSGAILGIAIFYSAKNFLRKFKKT